jgi:phage gpG-like protein
MEVDVRVDAGEAIRLIRSIKRQTREYVAVFEGARVYLETAYGSNFASRGAEVGGWAPYGAWSAEAGQPARLVRSGRLLESLTSLRGAPNDIGPKQATFGTNVPYAEFHQDGTREMPMRKVVFEPAGFAEYLAERVADHVISDFATLKGAFR